MNGYMNGVVTAVTALFAGSALAEAESAWTFSAGPAWRSQVKIETRGRIPARVPSERIYDIHGYTQEDVDNPSTWTDPQLKDNPNAAYDPLNPRLWGVGYDYSYKTDVQGRDYAVSSSEDASPMGLMLQGSYDFWKRDALKLGLNLRAAGYWNMKSSTGGSYYAGSTHLTAGRDWFLFDNAVSGSSLADFHNDVDPDIGDRPHAQDDGRPYTYEPESTSTTDYDSRFVTTRLRSDLYQIGLGPKVTWSPFADCCEGLGWLDVYGGVEVIGNIAYNKFEADGSSATSTDCLLGFGGNAGLVGNITDWLGVFGQIGYEWIDKTDISTRGFTADVDYSSFVVSAGIQCRF